MIYAGQPIYVSVSRVAPRHVRCEHCENEFIYELARVGLGGAAADGVADETTLYERAYQIAYAWFEHRLPDQVEAVPCPKCLKYQSHMYPAARDLRWGWVRGLGSQGLAIMPIVCVLAVFIAVVAFPNNSRAPFVVAGIIAGSLVAIGLLTAILFRLVPCDPNRWSESYRQSQATSLACTRDEFDRVAVLGGPFTEDLTAGREWEYHDTFFLWVLPQEITDEMIVPLITPEGRELNVELTSADCDGVFLDEDRVENAAGEKYRICLRVLSLHRLAMAALESEDT